MLETQMLSNPNLSASENCLVDVQDIERYYIKDNKLYCYGLEEKKLVRDDKRKLKTYIFAIKDDTIKKVENKKNLITLLIANIIVLFVGLIVLISMHQMEIGLFMIAFVLFINIALHNNDNALFHRCQEFYTLHKDEIKDYTEGIQEKAEPVEAEKEAETVEKENNK